MKERCFLWPAMLKLCAMKDISIFIAFAAGVLSFFSPCVLPLIPSYIAYITGLTLKDFEEKSEIPNARYVSAINSVLFILGFSFIFILLGVVAGALGQFLFSFKELIRITGGAIIIIFGLYIAGAFESGILSRSFKINLKMKPVGLAGSFIVGMIFAVGWTPCVGPILGSILILAGTSGTVLQGVWLLVAFSGGLGIAFLMTSIFLHYFLLHSKNITKFLPVINTISGGFLIIVGILLITNYFGYVSYFLRF